MTPRRVVVVGASLAGATTATTLRELGFDGALQLIGAEPHLPYERPALSKGYLTGDVDADTLLVRSASGYEQLGIEMRLGDAATRLDPYGRTVHLRSGDAVPYDALVLATGSENLRPPIPGLRTHGVHQLRTVDDADRLAASASTSASAVVVGMGFIGCEVAAALRRRGLDVTMVDRVPGPLAGPLGPELSDRVRACHEDAGVRVVGGVDVAALVGEPTVEGVRLRDGRLLTADLVVVGVGVRPATGWLTDAPLHLAGGAVGVDDAGRTSATDVYAAGDVAARCRPGGGPHLRTEHHRAAIDQGVRVAHALLDLPPPALSPSWFWSEQYDHVLHFAGEREGAQLLARDEPYVAFFTKGSTLTGVATIDNGRDFRRALRLLGSDVEPAALVDPDVDLRRVAAASLALPTAAAG